MFVKSAWARNRAAYLTQQILASSPVDRHPGQYRPCSVVVRDVTGVGDNQVRMQCSIVTVLPPSRSSRMSNPTGIAVLASTSQGMSPIDRLSRVVSELIDPAVRTEPSPDRTPAQRRLGDQEGELTILVVEPQLTVETRSHRLGEVVILIGHVEEPEHSAGVTRAVCNSPGTTEGWKTRTLRASASRCSISPCRCPRPGSTKRHACTSAKTASVNAVRRARVSVSAPDRVRPSHNRGHRRVVTPDSIGTPSID